MTVRFEDAWDKYLEVLSAQKESLLSDSGKIVVIRDLTGRIRLALEHRPEQKKIESLLAELHRVAGPFCVEQILDKDSLIAPESIFESKDAFEIKSGIGIWAIERLVTGADWGRGPLNSADQPPCATLYGLKGGVGRSTALSVWAWHLAKRGRKVLVLDLDLESPGVSSLLLPADKLPDFGLVDWFVEDAVGNADADLIDQMVATSPLDEDTRGRILVAPCRGCVGQDYLTKLSRVYLDIPKPGGLVTFGERLADILQQLTTRYKPDLVLLDSRAGLHDVAAISTTRLRAMTFMFGVGTRQTWDGYRILLRSWAKYPEIARDVRQRIRLVASQIPETLRIEYVDRFRLSGYDLFSELLYEEDNPNDPDCNESFNFDINDMDAPHDPLKINWARGFQDWDPTSKTMSDEELRAAFGDFLDRATELLEANYSAETVAGE
ncbi:MAG: ParA family protein [Deltaproteobacteria bacterium]|nr:ParA family protein [Deltaproteobacteria bacterium]